MTINTNAIIKLIIDVMGERELQVTATQSIKGALITGGCSLVGGLMAGPLGLAVGGASGGVLAAFITKGTFKPIAQILYELPIEEREQMAEEIALIIFELEINDLTELAKIALICQTITHPQNHLIDTLIAKSLPIIQNYIH